MKQLQRMTRILLVFVLAAVVMVLFSGYARELKSILDLKRQPESQPLDWSSGKLQIFPLSDQYLVVAGDFADFLTERVHAAYGERLKLADRYLAAGSLPLWSYQFLYNFAGCELAAEYHPQIRDKFEKADYFTITVNDQPMAIAENGYWLNANGLMRLKKAVDPGCQITRNAELVHFAYLKLAQPLPDRARVKVTTPDQLSAEFTYDDTRTLSRAIKVNQVGYAAEAGRKYGYFGLWLGTLGPMPTRQWVDREFHLRNAENDAVVYTGRLALRSEEQYTRKDDKLVPLIGEEVVEMDFSDWQTPGRYYLQIPGIGRSWEFVIGDDAIGRAFYVQTRGLFQQRSGIAKTTEHTQWPIGADHKISWRGHFAPNDLQYSVKSGCITNAAGEAVKLTPFEMVAATATDEALPDVYGGWWDAGDFDRRPYHFAVVDALLSVYLLFPENFSDHQLDLPESGNGIPDIIDEAAWGVDVWRRAQNDAGGVGCWLEATSHPKNPDPVTDTQRYYLAQPTCESSLEYAAYAAKLARAYRHCGATEQAELFLASARRAFDYALDPANRQVVHFEHPKLGKLTYREPEELPGQLLFKAALNLFLTTGEERYEPYVNEKNFKAALNVCLNTRPAYYLSELAEDERAFFSYTTRYRIQVRQAADKYLKSQEELAYRNVNWPLDHGFFLNLGWGYGLPLFKGSAFIMAWRTTDDPKYRDAALLLVDWMLGANPMGRSLTTGLGRVYPIRLLSLPNQVMSETLVDPMPGLTIYGFTGRVHYNALNMIYMLNYDPRSDHNFKGCHLSLMPHQISGDREMSRDDTAAWLAANLPVWRRHANLEDYAVDENEFTVWETMAPAAAAYGALLKPGWKPPPDWKDLQPVRDPAQLPGHIYLP